MKKLKVFLVGLIALGLIQPAFAATDLYKDSKTTENSNGHWDFQGNVHATNGTLTYRKQVFVLTSPTATTGSVTVDRSGSHFIMTNSAGPTVGGQGLTLTLPPAATGLTFKFSTATNQALSVRGSSATQYMLWGSQINKSRFTSPASTGSTITVVGLDSGRWLIEDMYNPAEASLGHSDWSSGSF